MSKPKFCPICAVKKVIHATQLKPQEDESYYKDVCPTPPMGWSSWNLFRNKINENLIKEIADAMADSGLVEAGYKYVNLDDCWQDSRRSEDGKINCDPYTFPSGIKALVDYVNAKGMKLGIYSSNGTLTCEDYPASYGHERQDARQYAQWGVEYFKYDFCHHVPVPTIAPGVVKITFACQEDEIVAYAYSAVLKGNARLIDSIDVDGGKYITGLSSRSGSAIFDISAKKSGTYSTTVTFKKESKEDKFLIITVNGKDKYEVNVPGSKAWTPEGKVHLDIELKESDNTLVITNPIGSAREGYAYQYTRMGKELKKATREYAQENNLPEKKIVYSICEWGTNFPWRWAPVAGNLWRTTPDIKPNWLSIIGIYDINVRLGKFAGVGSYNDPDMLEVGNGELTYDENYSHFALWCMMSAPLILGNDVRKFIKEDGTPDKENKIYQILTNKYLIGIDQDPLCVPCKRLNGSFGVDVLVKPLVGDKIAICIFNKLNKSVQETFQIAKAANAPGVYLKAKDSYDIFNCQSESRTGGNQISATLNPHSCAVYIVE